MTYALEAMAVRTGLTLGAGGTETFTAPLHRSGCRRTDLSQNWFA